jgi:lipoprotein-anchoring transpeptidase ErfK/SrfK
VAQADAALRQAAAAASRKDAVALKDQARRLLWQAGLTSPSAEEAASLGRRVAALNEEVLFSEEPVDGKFSLYEFKAGDRLWTLCYRTFPKDPGVRLEPGFLLWMNGLSDARKIHEGTILKVPREAVTLLVRKSQFRLWVLLGGVGVRDYPVGIGANDKTPEGQFEVETKIENPDWYAEGRRVPFGNPENPLGTRWMGFKRTKQASGYGIHGTSEPETVGKAASQGCIRMLSRDVEELFTWVAMGTQVTIVR